MLTPRGSTGRTPLISPRPGSYATTQRAALLATPPQAPLSPCGMAAGPITRPFNSQARVTFSPASQTRPGHAQRASAELGLFAAAEKVLRRSEIGGPEKNGLRRSLRLIGKISGGNQPAPGSPVSSPGQSIGGPDLAVLSQSFDFGSDATMPVGSALSCIY